MDLSDQGRRVWRKARCRNVSQGVEGIHLPVRGTTQKLESQSVKKSSVFTDSIHSRSSLSIPERQEKGLIDGWLSATVPSLAQILDFHHLIYDGSCGRETVGKSGSQLTQGMRNPLASFVVIMRGIIPIRTSSLRTCSWMFVVNCAFQRGRHQTRAENGDHCPFPVISVSPGAKLFKLALPPFRHTRTALNRVFFWLSAHV